MRRFVYKAMLGLPLRVLSGASSVVGITSAFWPERVKAFAGVSMTEDQIRYVGIVLCAVAIAYFALLWLLKPGEKDQGDHPAQTSTGPQSPNLGGTFNGPVEFHYGPSPAATQPEKSPHSYDIEALNSGLRKAILGAAHNVPTQPGLARFIVEPEPDLPLRGLLDRVYAAAGPAPKDAAGLVKFYQRIDNIISDKVSVKGLHTWGRLQGGLIKLDAEAWQLGAFSHKNQNLLVPVPYGEGVYYSDLHFWKHEIDKIWPKPLRTTNDDKP
jgi:hypothetical protein